MHRARNLFSPEPEPLLVGQEVATDEWVELLDATLSMGLHLMGPTGCGKTSLLAHFFEQFARRRYPVIVFGAKGDFGPTCCDLAISTGQSRRLLLFDPSDPAATIGYSPLRPNGLAPITHAKAVREAVRAAWSSASFDQTPQLARCLFLVLAAARELELTLVEALGMLRPGSEVRRAVLPRLRDVYVRESFEYLASLPERRQEELTASTTARLEPFVNDPVIRRIIAQQDRALDLGAVLDAGQLLVVNLERNRPLREDDQRLLGKLILNDLLQHIYARDRDARTPVTLIIDEVQTWVTHDLCAALDQGRELGLRTIVAHQHEEQLLLEDESKRLLSSVRHDARTKIVFGGGWAGDLRPMVEHVFLSEIDPLRVKDEILSLETELVESTRVQLSRNKTVSDGEAIARPSSTSLGLTDLRGKAKTASSAKMLATTEIDSEADVDGETQGASSGGLEALAIAVTPTGDMIQTTQTGTSSGSIALTSRAHVSGHAAAKTEADTLGEANTDQQSRALTATMTKGETPSQSHEVSEGKSETVLPFLEPRQKRVVSSRTFWSTDEQFDVFLQKVAAQPQGHFVLKAPDAPPLFLRAPVFERPRVSARQRAAALERMHALPYYSRPEEIVAETEQRQERLLAPPKAPGRRRPRTDEDWDH